MFEAAKRFRGVLGCLIAVAACGGSPGPAGGAGAGGSAAGSGGAPPATPTGGAGAPMVTGSGSGGATRFAPDGAVAEGGTAGTAPAIDASNATDTLDRAAPEGGTGSALPKSVLVFTRSTNAYVHESKPIAAAAIKTALAPLGVAGELSEDIGVFTAANLARFGAIVLVDTSGKPLGDPGTAELNALAAFVKAGGGLVFIHAADATTYDVALPYVPLVGAHYLSHPGDVRTTTCFPLGTHAAAAQLPASFPMLDEIFTFDSLRADLTIDVECLATDGKMRLPIAWHRAEGAGRVFNTAFGHPLELWAPDGLLLTKHVIPAVLWTLRL